MYKFILLIQCVQTYITNSMCTNLYLHSACVGKYVPLSVCVCDIARLDFILNDLFSTILNID